MLRLAGRLFFANAERIGDKIRPLIEEAKPRVLALDLSGVFDIEYTALKMLTEAEERQRERGVTLWLVGLTPEVLAMVSARRSAKARPGAHVLQSPAGAREISRGCVETAEGYGVAGAAGVSLALGRR